MSKEKTISQEIRSFKLSEIPKDQLEPFKIEGKPLGIKLTHSGKIEIWTLDKIEEDNS